MFRKGRESFVLERSRFLKKKYKKARRVQYSVIQLLEVCPLGEDKIHLLLRVCDKSYQDFSNQV